MDRLGGKTFVIFGIDVGACFDRRDLSVDADDDPTLAFVVCDAA